MAPEQGGGHVGQGPAAKHRTQPAAATSSPGEVWAQPQVGHADFPGKLVEQGIITQSSSLPASPWHSGVSEVWAPQQQGLGGAAGSPPGAGDLAEDRWCMVQHSPWSTLATSAVLEIRWNAAQRCLKAGDNFWGRRDQGGKQSTWGTTEIRNVVVDLEAQQGSSYSPLLTTQVLMGCTWNDLMTSRKQRNYLFL